MSESRMVGSSRLSGTVLAALGWAAALLMFFPVFWMVLTAFKHERDAFTSPPKFIFEPTLEQFDAVLSGGLEVTHIDPILMVDNCNYRKYTRNRVKAERVNKLDDYSSRGRRSDVGEPRP